MKKIGFYLPEESLFRANIKAWRFVQFMGLTMRVGIIDTDDHVRHYPYRWRPHHPLEPLPESDQQMQEAQRMQAESASGEVATESGSFIHLNPIEVGFAHAEYAQATWGKKFAQWHWCRK